MGIKTKAQLAAFFETGDKPTQAQFADLIDTMVVIPATGATGFIEVEGTASSTSRSAGAFGIQILAAAATASAVGLLGVPDSFSTLGKAIASAATTAAAQQLLGGGAVGRNIFAASTTAAVVDQLPIVEEIGGQIETPATGNYVVSQYAAYPFNIEWLRAQTVSGNTQLTGQIDGVNITGLVSVAADTTEVAASAAGANAVAVGNTVRLVASGISGASKLSFSMKIVRT